jgi:biopolymer transport protein ExbB
MEAASRGARIARNRLHEQLRHGLSSLSTIAKTAPLVGLIGTSSGILDSFRGYVGNKYGYIAFLATNLAEALVPAAAGLLIAVLAMWRFNWRSDRLAVFDTEMEVASQELVKYLELQRRAGKL